MDLNSIAYVESVNSNLICCICQTPFVEPVVIDSCGHTFCKDCITRSLSTRSTCPVDRSHISNVNELKPAAKIIVNMVNELLVYCPNKNDGCLYQGQRQLLNFHLQEECLFTKLECRNEECREMILKKDLSKHMESCIARMVKCESCKEIVSLSTLEGHKITCPVNNIECPYCHTTRIQPEHTLHLEECPDKYVTCRHAEFGCVWKGRQHDLSVHIGSCSYEPLKEFFKMYKQRNYALEQENQQLKTKFQDLRNTVDFLEGQVSAISDWLSTFIDPKGLVSNAEGEPSISTIHELLLSDNDRMKNEIENLSASLTDLELRQNVAIMTEGMRMQEEIHSIKNICHGLRMQMHYLLMERSGGEPSVGTAGPKSSVIRPGLIGPMGLGRTVPPNTNDSSSASNPRPPRLMGSESPRKEKL
ncbi:17974_t:CDS:2 [Funneliformis caledonium]|uniref:17974_t:CDS:1 n=2 Tax=Funneliformis TaxID=1117308 RepID=A0A9N9F051_9GLOM|nr:17974_t:CDS:2 [Funneliformis caledonium]